MPGPLGDRLHRFDGTELLRWPDLLTDSYLAPDAIVDTELLLFLGEFADEQRASFARDADVAAFPFLAFETHGLVVDEALSLGLPTLVPDHGAPRERVGARGRAIPIHDADAWRLALEQLLDEPEQLRAMRAAEHLCWPLEDHAAGLEELYGELLREARA